jgi:hypothetical protein
VDDDVSPRQDPREIRKAADVVEVVVAEEEMDVRCPFEEGCVLGVEKPSQARAGVDEQEAGAFADGEAGGLPSAAGHPAHRAEQCHIHLVLTFVDAVRATSVYSSGRRYNV